LNEPALFLGLEAERPEFNSNKSKETIMSNFLTDSTDAEDELASPEELKGHIRAIEAILLELADSNTILAAKESLRRRRKNNGRNRKLAEILDKTNQPYDDHAEAALDALIRLKSDDS
jgi:CelD/BcsL family acetyltransferase involved in cellulose biosynthesis